MVEPRTRSCYRLGMLLPAVETLIALAVDEDFGRGDVTSQSIFSAEAEAQGRIVAKEELVICGLEVAARVFAYVDQDTHFSLAATEGQGVQSGQTVAEVGGKVRSLVAAERTALNFLQRLSGIATFTRQFVGAVQGSKARICDTRKTAPGYRLLDKQAVRAGGGHNHRSDLASGILIKDNHIAACGSVGEAIKRARAVAPHGLRVEVEVTAAAQIEEALCAGAEIVLLDNMSPSAVKQAVELIAGRATVEVSGGVRLDNVRLYAEAGADLISVGALTHSARAVDLSLEL